MQGNDAQSEETAVGRKKFQCAEDMLVKSIEEERQAADYRRFNFEIISGFDRLPAGVARKACQPPPQVAWMWLAQTRLPVARSTP